MPAEAVLVDTSVFVEFFRGRAATRFEDLVKHNLVFLSDFVRLELISGVRRHEIPRLSRVLGGLRQVPLDPEIVPEAETMLDRIRPRGMTVGIVDLLIAAQARRLACPVMSLDRVFRALALRGLVRLHQD